MISEERLLQVIRSPIVSEKSTMVAEKENGFVLKVLKDATKREIKLAVETLFEVQVASVNTLVQKGKVKRTRNGEGRRSDTKKAYVTLKEGQDLDFSAITTE